MAVRALAPMVAVSLALCSTAVWGEPPGNAAPADRPRLLVADLSAQGVPPVEAAAMTDAVVGTLQERALFEVLSSKDVQTIISAERRRLLSGGPCRGKRTDCATDLGVALGARFVLTGSLSQLGSTYQLELQVVDTIRGERLGQSSRLAHDLTTLRLQLPYAVAEATGSPLPPPPSRVWQYSVIAAGGAAVIAGGVLGMLAISQTSVLNDELCPGGVTNNSCTGTNLRPLSYYRNQNTLIGRDKSIALALMAAGAGLVAAGLVFMPPPEGGPRVALVPHGAGVAVAGEFW